MSKIKINPRSLGGTNDCRNKITKTNTEEPPKSEFGDRRITGKGAHVRSEIIVGNQFYYFFVGDKRFGGAPLLFFY